MQNPAAIAPINTDFYFSRQLISLTSFPSKGKETHGLTQDKQVTNAEAQMAFLAEGAVLAGCLAPVFQPHCWEPAEMVRPLLCHQMNLCCTTIPSSALSIDPHCSTTCCRHKCSKAGLGMQKSGIGHTAAAKSPLTPFRPDTFSYLLMMRRGTEHVVS